MMASHKMLTCHLYMLGLVWLLLLLPHTTVVVHARTYRASSTAGPPHNHYDTPPLATTGDVPLTSRPPPSAGDVPALDDTADKWNSKHAKRLKQHRLRHHEQHHHAKPPHNVPPPPPDWLSAAQHQQHYDAEHDRSSTHSGTQRHFRNLASASSSSHRSSSSTVAPLPPTEWTTPTPATKLRTSTAAAINSPKLSPSSDQLIPLLPAHHQQSGRHFSLSPRRTTDAAIVAAPVRNNGATTTTTAAAAFRNDVDDDATRGDVVVVSEATDEDDVVDDDEDAGDALDVRSDNNASATKKMRSPGDSDSDNDYGNSVSFTTQKPALHSASHSPGMSLSTASPTTAAAAAVRFVPAASTSGNKFEQIPLNDSTVVQAAVHRSWRDEGGVVNSMDKKPPPISIVVAKQVDGEFPLDGRVSNEHRDVSLGGDLRDVDSAPTVEIGAGNGVRKDGDDDNDDDDEDDDEMYDELFDEYQNDVLMVMPDPDDGVVDGMENANQNDVNADFGRVDEVDLRKLPHDYNSYDYPSDNTMADDSLTDKKLNDLGTPEAVNRSFIEWNAGDTMSRLHQHVQRIPSCKYPAPRIIPLPNPDPRKIYVPHCTVLHRCGDDTGCCQDVNLRCEALRTEQVELFFITTVRGTSQRSPEWMLFTNHTECHCVPRTPTPLAATGRSSGGGGGGGGGTQRTAAGGEQPTEAPRPMWPANCACVGHFDVINVTVGDVDGPCYCGCRNAGGECDDLSSGQKAFTVADKRCIQQNQCVIPSCKHGSYNRTTNACPTIQGKINIALNHRPRRHPPPPQHQRPSTGWS